MNKYLLLDETYQYHWREERLKKAQQLGFDFISQCTIELYKKYKSSIKVADIVGSHTDTVRRELKKLNQLGADIQFTKAGKPNKKYNQNVEDQKIIESYLKCRTVSLTAWLLGTSFYRVYTILKRNNIRRGGRTRHA